MTRLAALIYAGLAAFLIGFQISLSLGAPWGHLAMGGQWPGAFPPALRVLAVFQALLISLFSLIVLRQATVIAKPNFPRWAFWIVMVFFTLAVIANLATQSPAERALWAPVAIVMWICCMWIWLARRKSH